MGFGVVVRVCKENPDWPECRDFHKTVRKALGVEGAKPFLPEDYSLVEEEEEGD